MATERTVLVRLRANANQFAREMSVAANAVRGMRNEINTTNDRTAWLAQGIAALAPVAVSVGATAIPVVMGLGTQLGVAAGAAGVLALGMVGIGDGLKALNTFQLDPTVENLEKVRLEMEKLGPAGADFVRFLDEIGDQLSVLRMDARDGMFPGMTDGIEDLMSRLPEVRNIVSSIAEGIGELAADAGAGLAGPEFDEFFDFLETDAKPILLDFGRTIGNFIDGIASLIVAFGPLTDDFSGGLLDMSRSFEEWAEGLSNTAGWNDFVDYIRKTTPMVLDFAGSLFDAVVEIVEAAAPVGDVVLPMLTRLLDVVANLANTPLGSIAIMGAAFASIYGRTKALGELFGSGGGISRLTPQLQANAKAARESAKTLRTTSIPAFRDFSTAMLTAGTSSERWQRASQARNKVLAADAKNVLLSLIHI